MKREYRKPEIMFEDFTLSTNIASGCELKINNQVSGTCGYPYEGGGGTTLFTAAAGSDVCNIPIEDSASNGFCYHVPIDTYNVFNS